MKYISYIRVSTGKQKKSGLGLEAQQHLIKQYIGNQNGELIAEYEEVESGKRNDRPQLAEALRMCKRHKATLVIATLDRLGRRVSLISRLMEQNTDLVCADMPHASTFELHIRAAIAEEERRKISERTKAGLAAAKRRGVKLGVHGKKVLSKQNKRAADQFARSMTEHMEALERQGYTTLMEKTEALNRRGIPTASGSGRWYISTVHNLVKRIEALA